VRPEGVQFIFVFTLAVLAALCPYFSSDAFAAEIVAWGDNTHGQCEVPNGKDYVAITAGMYHSLALRFDGSIVAWGDNTAGQCNAPADNSFTAVAAGAYHNIAIRNDGSLAAWGDNTYRQCDTPKNGKFTAVASGAYHNIALTADGTLAAWGDNTYGQCNLPTGSNFAKIACGEYHSKAIRKDGSAVVWGWNNYHQNYTPPRNFDFKAISVGASLTVAINADGSLAAWGWNGKGQCDVPRGNNFITIAGHWDHNLALKTADHPLPGSSRYGLKISPTSQNFVAVLKDNGYDLAFKSDGTAVLQLRDDDTDQARASFTAAFSESFLEAYDFVRKPATLLIFAISGAVLLRKRKAKNPN
jgi:hypothetical protein